MALEISMGVASGKRAGAVFKRVLSEFATAVLCFPIVTIALTGQASADVLRTLQFNKFDTVPLEAGYQGALSGNGDSYNAGSGDSSDCDQNSLICPTVSGWAALAPWQQENFREFSRI